MRTKILAFMLALLVFWTGGSGLVAFGQLNDPTGNSTGLEDPTGNDRGLEDPDPFFEGQDNTDSEQGEEPLGEIDLLPEECQEIYARLSTLDSQIAILDKEIDDTNRASKRKRLQEEREVLAVERASVQTEFIACKRHYGDTKNMAPDDNDAYLPNFIDISEYERVFDGPGIKSGSDQIGGNLRGISQSKDGVALAIAWVRFFVEIAGVIAVIAIIYGGLLMIFDFGDGERMAKGRKIVLYVAVGMLVILGSFAIVNTIITRSFGA